MSETERRGRTDRQERPSEAIATSIREQIALGELRTGDELPSLSKLQEEFGVAKMTATRAMSRLRAEGLIVSHPGSPTRVAGNRAGLSPAAQFERVHRTGRIRLGNEHTHIEQTGHTKAIDLLAQVRETLELTTDSPPVIHRTRVVYRDNTPEYWATSFIPSVHYSMRKGWRAVEDKLLSYDLIGEISYACIAKFLGEEVAREEYNVSAVATSAQEARGLRTQPGAPSLRILVGMFTTTGLPLECGVYSYPSNVSLSFPSTHAEN